MSKLVISLMNLNFLIVAGVHSVRRMASGYGIAAVRALLAPVGHRFAITRGLGFWRNSQVGAG